MSIIIIEAECTTLKPDWQLQTEKDEIRYDLLHSPFEE